ncbi:uncharacterized protein BDZ99DRAFT_570529 [Mytilinidion resinicola]|uniref:Uncharacterized protein n=1 Tax=Mytilinidion resinicola TaxID=574789 RepID=A0A6A6YMS1_9PEZI|nr:uncharacterized protein BDZ99DRAFT_570529 [Mytilinidion resinicola]KAF2809873.1 hypothetical protein BDZ99DRAFT_570529 [Mytilinidion resinicola]
MAMTLARATSRCLEDFSAHGTGTPGVAGQAESRSAAQKRHADVTLSRSRDRPRAPNIHARMFSPMVAGSRRRLRRLNGRSPRAKLGNLTPGADQAGADQARAVAPTAVGAVLACTGPGPDIAVLRIGPIPSCRSPIADSDIAKNEKGNELLNIDENDSTGGGQPDSNLDSAADAETEDGGLEGREVVQPEVNRTDPTVVEGEFRYSFYGLRTRKE